ncbi:MAG: hypothetical protein IPM78_10200 [Moraxellaceae bacterium]|nr:hypothetical protein [Moraxellaceae bacterium]
MTDKKASKLTALQLRYSQSLSEQLAVISAGFLAVCEGLANDNTWQKMHYLVHNIAGSAGTFGYANLPRGGAVFKPIYWKMSWWLWCRSRAYYLNKS